MKKLFTMTLVAVGFAFWILPGTAASQGCPGGISTEEWAECRRFVLSACAFVGATQTPMCEAAALQKYLAMRQIAQRQQAGVRPVNAWDCPGTYPIKGNFTTYNSERCIFHVPDGQFYAKTKPEMCYANPADAIADGCRQSLR